MRSGQVFRQTWLPKCKPLENAVHWLICLYVRSLAKAVYLLRYLLICLDLSIDPFINLSIYLSINLSIYLMCLLTYLLISMLIYLLISYKYGLWSIYWSIIYWSIYWSSFWSISPTIYTNTRPMMKQHKTNITAETVTPTKDTHLLEGHGRWYVGHGCELWRCCLERWGLLLLWACLLGQRGLLDTLGTAQVLELVDCCWYADGHWQQRVHTCVYWFAWTIIGLHGQLLVCMDNYWFAWTIIGLHVQLLDCMDNYWFAWIIIGLHG